MDEKFDIVAVQEVMSSLSTHRGVYRPHFRAFVDKMHCHMFKLSIDVDFTSTKSHVGRGIKGQEHFCFFHREDRVEFVEAGYIFNNTHLIRVMNPNESRVFNYVPYFARFMWRQPGTEAERSPFCLISIHLSKDDDEKSVFCRIHEWKKIGQWIAVQKETHGSVDFIVLGDANMSHEPNKVELQSELDRVIESLKTTAGLPYMTLNQKMQRTNDPLREKHGAYIMCLFLLRW